MENGRQIATRSQKIVAFTVLAIVFFFVFMFRTVGAGQVGIITRFGEVSRTAGSGIAIKLPWPIERLTKMEIRVQKEEMSSSAATSDLQDVKATLALNYRLDEATAIKLYKEIGPDYKERVIIPTLQESFKASSAQYTAGELITKRPEVKGKAYDLVRSRLGKYNIDVIDLNLTNLEYSAEFTKSIEAKQVAQQNAEKARFNLEQANLDAQSQDVKAKTLTPEYLQLQAIEKWNGIMPNAVGGSNIFNIPVVK